MEFQFWVLENVRLPVRISQRSNLKYIKTVIDNLDDRLRADFRNSCLGFFADVSEIQFSTQLIQAPEYAIFTGLHAGSFPEGDRYTKALEKRRLKEKYFKSLEKISCAQLEKAFIRASTPRVDRYKLGLALIVEGVITAPDNNVDIDEDTLALVDDLELFFSYPWAKVGYRRLSKRFRGTWARKMSDAKTKNVNYTIHGLSIVMQIWAYEAMPELGKHFGERVGERSPRLLCWTSTKQSQQRTYDAFFRDVQLHVHATLRPTEAERDLPYVANLVLFLDRPVQFLDDLARSVVGPQFHEVAPASGGHEGSAAGDEHDDESDAGAEDDETSASNDHQTPKGNGDDGSKADDSGDSSRDASSEIGTGDTEDDEDASGQQSGALPTPMVAPSTFGVDERSQHDDDHANKGEMHEVNDGEGGEERSPQDDDRAEEGDMQELNDPGETVPTLPSDENEEGP
ncbi:Hypothetical predicted protein [Olea europaea subsp. europaea]|uniref:DUF1985 domain-containing protein n=1 Tax=Olea europaea subsp. europaea TaxID=158383 RepID=A0A8S0PR89_OLEEU|nr:Hypothetical predicted protein [Olea europaea subsp. europaea]